MKINRRDFLLVTAGLAALGPSQTEAAGLRAHPGRVVNAGSADKYASDGVYSTFRHQGFFLVRQGEHLFALSSTCTHRRCTLVARPDHSFYCKCHGSTFDPAGHVTKGPARRDLPRLTLKTNSQGEVMVTTPER